ncbi:MAG: hypothetical protein ABI655_14660 [Phenylobacterium sp.]
MRPWPAILAAVALAAPAAAAERDVRIQALNAQLLSHDSATGVLQTRCAQPIRARRLLVAKPPQPPAELAAAGQPVRYRRVALLCGDQVISHAENWYLPARLTPQMNAALETGQTPFGVVVTPLGFHRRTLSARVLHGRRAGEVLQHRAVLETPDGRPFSLVVETYTERALAAAR